VTLARLDAILGHDAECRSLVRTALEDSRQTGSGSIDDYSAGVLGLLELGRGQLEPAIAHLTRCAELHERHGTGLLGVVQWAGDLIEAQVRADDLGGARRTLELIETNAERTDVRWEHAMAARGRGMLAGELDYEDAYAAALAIHGNDTHFERARTLLLLGMRRRRSRRRAAARDALREALTYFETAGTEPWAEQARIELRAAGEAPADLRTPGGSLRVLTPQELQVALTVAAGATNKETAASLFLSTKTVEFHLSNTYRKLGVRSRAELVRRVDGLA
jgi:DNA-binding CsgD family transcriptional regulator